MKSKSIFLTFCFLFSAQQAHLCVKTFSLKNAAYMGILKSGVHKHASILKKKKKISLLSMTYFYNKEYLALQAWILKNLHRCCMVLDQMGLIDNRQEHIGYSKTNLHF